PRRVVHGRPAAQDVHRVIEPAQQPGGVEVTGLLPGVRDDAVRVGDQQAAPHLPVLPPGPVFLGAEVAAGEDERRGKVVPVGLAREVGRLEVVPWGLAGGPRGGGGGGGGAAARRAGGWGRAAPCPASRRWSGSSAAAAPRWCTGRAAGTG